MQSCRACLTFTEDEYYHLLDPLYEEKGPNSDVAEVPRILDCFNKCVPLNITEQELEKDTWTARFICKKCKLELERVYHFIKRAKLSDKILKNRSHSLKYVEGNGNISTSSLSNDKEQSSVEVNIDYNGINDDMAEYEKVVVQEEIPEDFRVNVGDQVDEENNLAIEGNLFNYNLGYSFGENKNENERLPLSDMISENINENIDIEEEYIEVTEPVSNTSPTFDKENRNLQTDFDDESSTYLSLIEENFQSLIASNVPECETISIEVPCDDDNDNDRQYVCELCGEDYKYQRHLIQHYNDTHINEGNYHFQCKECQKFFPSKNILNIHNRKDHLNEEYKDCDICGKLLLKKVFNKHYGSHSRQRSFFCTKCPNAYNTKESLKQHMTVHSRKRIRNIQCEECGREFFTIAALTSHLQTHKDDRKTFKCAICNKIFLRHLNLKLHMRLHLGVTMSCPHCQKEFVRRRDLEVHIRFHTKEFPFSCSQCGRRFAIRSHLKEHERDHQGVNYSCNICGKAFKRTASLRHHSFEHTSMPFACSLCQKGFPTRFKLRRHIRYVHDDQFPNGYDLQLADTFILKVDNESSHSLENSESNSTPNQLDVINEAVEGGDPDQMQFIVLSDAESDITV